MIIKIWVKATCSAACFMTIGEYVGSSECRVNTMEDIT